MYAYRLGLVVRIWRGRPSIGSSRNNVVLPINSRSAVLYAYFIIICFMLLSPWPKICVLDICPARYVPEIVKFSFMYALCFEQLIYFIDNGNSGCCVVLWRKWRCIFQLLGSYMSGRCTPCVKKTLALLDQLGTPITRHISVLTLHLPAFFRFSFKMLWHTLDQERSSTTIFVHDKLDIAREMVLCLYVE